LLNHITSFLRYIQAIFSFLSVYFNFEK